jgi:O-antigen ligase
VESKLNSQQRTSTLPGSNLFLSQVVLYILLLDSISKYDFLNFRLSAIVTVSVSAISLFLFVNLKIFAKREESNTLKASKLLLACNLIFFFSILQAVLRSNGNQNTQQNFLCVVIAYSSYLFASKNVSSVYFWHSVKSIRLSCALASFVYLVSCGYFGIGNSQIYFPRALSMISCLGLALSLPLLREKPNHFYFFSTIFSVTVILSQSRTAIIVLLLTLIYISLRQQAKNASRKLTQFFVTFLGIYFLVTAKVVQERFKFYGDQANVGGLQFNTAGRVKIWGLLLDKSQDSLVFGHGLGRSEDLIEGYFGTIAQPHNDYLRVLYDTGIIGLVALILVILVIFFRRISSTQTGNVRSSGVRVLGNLVLFQFCVFMITDNPLVYPFYLMPMAFILGLARSNIPSYFVGKI